VTRSGLAAVYRYYPAERLRRDMDALCATALVEVTDGGDIRATAAGHKPAPYRPETHPNC
jgi:hypothetical protein